MSGYREAVIEVVESDERVIIPETERETRLGMLCDLIVAATNRAICLHNAERVAILDQRYARAEDALIAEQRRVILFARSLGYQF